MSIRVTTRWDQRLHAAAVKGNVAEIEKVLDSGRVHVDCVDRDGTTPLIIAAANGHLNCVRELLEQGANPSAKRKTGTNALFFASQGGFIDVLKLLIESGISINQASKDGGTSLIVAAQCGHLDIVEELLTRGSDPHMAMRDRATAVFVSAQNGHCSVVRTLLQAGARANARRIDGASPLWIAAQMGHDKVVKILLAYGADVDSCRHDGATPLFKAAHKGHADVIREILPYKPKISLLKNGESALHAAALYGNALPARLLLEAGSDGTLKNDEGLTPLQIAVQADHPQTAAIIRDYITRKRDIQTSTPTCPRVTPTPRRGESGPSSRYSSLETIVESSPIIPRKQTDLQRCVDQFASCELTAVIDGKTRPHPSQAVQSNEGFTNRIAPSPSPSIVSEPHQPFSNGLKGHNTPRRNSYSHSDLRSVKNFFQWTLSSFRKSNSTRKNSSSNNSYDFDD